LSHAYGFILAAVHHMMRFVVNIVTIQHLCFFICLALSANSLADELSKVFYDYTGLLNFNISISHLPVNGVGQNYGIRHPRKNKIKRYERCTI